MCCIFPACSTVPEEVDRIHKEAFRGWTPAHIEFYEPGVEGPYTGDCSSFTARVEALAERDGLRTDNCFRWGFGEPHEWAMVQSRDGRWWHVDNQRMRAVEAREGVCR